MSAKQTIYRVPLLNVRVIGQMCGYGEGRTREEAAQKALEKARAADPHARYDGVHVLFADRVVC